VLNSPTEGFPWDDLRKIFRGYQRMAKVPNAVEILRKISSACVGCASVTDDRRQTDTRQTDGQHSTAYSSLKSISCRRQTGATRCITATLLQTNKPDDECDKRCSFVGNSVLYTSGQAHFEGCLQTGPTVGVYFDLPSECPSYMTFVPKYRGLTAIRYTCTSFVVPTKLILMTKTYRHI